MDKPIRDHQESVEFLPSIVQPLLLVPVIVYNVPRGHIPHCSVNHTDKPFLLSGSSRIQRPQALQLGGDHLYCIESRTTRDGGEMEEPILGWSWGITTLCPRALGFLHCRGLQRLGSWHGPSSRWVLLLWELIECLCTYTPTYSSHKRPISNPMRQ